MTASELRGKFFSIITFPGIILYVLFYSILCDFMKIKITKKRYFGFRGATAYVTHEPPASYYQLAILTFGPFIFNTISALILLFIAEQHPDSNYLDLLGWIGFSIGVNAIMGFETVNHLWTASKHLWKEKPFILLLMPFILFLKIMNEMKPYWGDLLYAGALYLLVISLL